MYPRVVALVPAEELKGWPTKRLLGRLKALRRLEEDFDSSDLEREEVSHVEGIIFKSDPRWSAAYKDLKTILDTRENIRSGRADRLARINERRS